MKNQIATSPSQSQRLIASGVAPKTADMFWQVPITISQKKRGEHILLVRREGYEFYSVDTPAWSTSRLLELMPDKILVDDAWFECQICKCTFGYEVRYHSDVFKDPFGCLCKSTIEGCVEAIEWLTKEGYKLNQIEK